MKEELSSGERYFGVPFQIPILPRLIPVVRYGLRSKICGLSTRKLLLIGAKLTLIIFSTAVWTS
jgi:hypothetical protein